jgi:CheY-like chemotaxis protein
VIADLLMPHVDGFEFISRLRTVPVGRDVPILVWTVKAWTPPSAAGSTGRRR